MNPADASATFAALRDILASCANKLTVVEDTPELYYLDTEHIMPNGKPLYFGSVRIGKRYVSFHLMPVYVEPGLLAPVSDALRKRMQGKSCFNFTRTDQDLLTELADLTRRGYALYDERGYV